MQKILSDNKKTFLFFLILSLLFYGNSIKNGFSLDDSYITVTNYPIKGRAYVPNNELIAKGFSGIPKLWRSHYGHEKDAGYDYRPIVMTMFAIEYAVFGQAPHINHFINIVIYALLVFCLFLLLKKCLQEYSYKETFALVCSILFLAHPIHSEVVNNIKCRDELLALLFALLATLQVFKFYELKRIKHLIFSICFLFLGLYSKLSAAVFVGLIPLILFFFSKMDKKKLGYIFLGLVACFIIYARSKGFLITEKSSRSFYHFENPLYTESISFYTRILFALKVFGTYVRLLLFPYPLRFYYGSAMFTTQVNPLDFEVIIGLVFLIASSYYCYKSKSKIALFGLLFFLISIAPVTNFLQIIAGVLGDRLCLTASIGFMVLLTSVVSSFYKTMPTQITALSFIKKPLGYLSGILLICLFYIWHRNIAWDSEFSLYDHDAQYSEKSSGINNLLGNKYFEMISTSDKSDKKKYPQQVLINKILKHYALAIQDDSGMYSAYNNTGVIYFSYLHQPDLALTYFIKAIRFKAGYPQAYENIGNYYDKKGMFIQAFKNYRIATLENPRQYKSYTALISMLIERNLFSSAYPIILEADKNFPKDYFITTQYANYILMSGDNQKGMQKLEEAYQIYPNKKLAEYLFNKWNEFNNTEKAEYYRSQHVILQQ
ncbi:MAG: tetratricopeptide repeat protein [Bacteroidia bacterium]